MAIEVVIPMLGITIEKGTIVEWLKQEGDAVEKGEIILILEVEKATTEVESPASGILAKILIPKGVEVPILSVAAIITRPGEELPAQYAAHVSGGGAPKPSGEGVSPVMSVEVSTASTRSQEGIGAVPAARRLAKEHGIDLIGITGTGPGGSILLRDVETSLSRTPKEVEPAASTLARKLAEKKAVPLGEVEGHGIRGRIMRADVITYIEKVEQAGPGLGVTIPMSSIRQVIARRMSESAFTAPHIYFFAEVCLDPLMEYRKAVLPDFEKAFKLRPSINDFLIKAVALNLCDFPMLNARIKGDGIQIMPEINMGLAVAVPEGLVVPAIALADRCGLVEIVRQRTDLVKRAREGNLSLEEMQRGTFTISSLAQYDITHFTAILNPPQSGILSVAKTDEKLALVDGRVEVKHVVQLGLSVDHRIIDGAMAADFLQNLKWKMERPAFTFLTL
ncbi:MAG: 2-oxo acid dehydrogenase subunit E2 [Deltaproteobacteria bacterium]|nr:2-oxo acid dehydrogenase subunit E2 [Deltaproteobacteria bacterium]